MERCKDCLVCRFAYDFKRKNNKKCEVNKVKKEFLKHKCENPVTKEKKRRIMESKDLFSARHGGQIQGEIASTYQLNR